MVILRYMFWTMALFMFGGCSLSQRPALQYRWGLIAGESSGDTSVMLFAADAVTGEGGFGYDSSGGVLLNQRSERVSVANFADDLTFNSFKVNYNESHRSGNNYGHRRHYNMNSNVSRRVTYTMQSGG